MKLTCRIIVEVEGAFIKPGEGIEVHRIYSRKMTDDKEFLLNRLTKEQWLEVVKGEAERDIKEEYRHLLKKEREGESDVSNT